MNRTLVIDGVAIDIPNDAYVDIKQFSHIGSTQSHVRTLVKLPDAFGSEAVSASGNTTWMTRETFDGLTEWTVFLS